MTSITMELEAKYLDSEFEVLVETLQSKHHVPGLSIAVVDNGEVLTKGYGWARLPDVPAGPHTLYYAGSTTKAMLAAALGCAMNQKTDEVQSNQKLQILKTSRWSTSIKDILDDDFILEDASSTSNITVEDALSHRTGFAGADLMYGSWMGQRPKGIVSALRHLQKPDAPIRTKWQYNNLMYSVVGDVLESVTGMEWGSAVRHFIWNPLGMTSTFCHDSEVPNERRSELAQGYFWTEPDFRKTSQDLTQDFIPEPYLDFAGIAPAGSVISSVADYAKWMKELLAASISVGKTGDGVDGGNLKHESSVITPALFSELSTPRVFQPILPTASQNAQTTPRGYSLGWFHLPSTAGIHHPVMAHGGGLTGFGAQLYLLPSDGFGVIVMANTAISSNRIGETLCLELMGRKLGMRDEERADFAKSLTVFPPSAESIVDSSAQDDDTESKETEDCPHDMHISDSDWAAFVSEVVGAYYNPAYGHYQINGSQQHEKIIYDPQVPLKDRAERDAKRAQARALSLIPVGHRTWHNRLFLRSRSDTFVDLLATAVDDDSSQENRSGFFDLEYMTVHGKRGADQNSCTSPAPILWQSERWCLYGASIKRATCPAASEQQGRTSGGETWSIGVRLGNASLAEDGNNGADWETKMVWFEKVQG